MSTATPTPLRIACVSACPYPVPQGSQVFLRNNALALQLRGHYVCLVTYGHGQGKDKSGLPIFRSRRIPGDAKTQAGPSFAKPFLDLALVSTLRRVIREEKIDVVIAHNYEGLLVALLAGKRPLIYHAHNAMADELPYYFRFKGLAARFGRWLDHTFPKRADQVIVPHARLAGHLIVRGCDREKITVILPPMDAHEFTPGKVADGLPPVLYTGNLDAYQNLGLLQDAMVLVRKKHPEAVLKIATAEAGSVAGAEMVNTKGFDALQRVLAEDAVLAVPRVSWSGYPVKLMNAMAAGKAMVACQSAAYPLTHEETGLIVPDNDAQAFADALLRLMDNKKLRARMGKAARAIVETEYQPDRVGAALEAIAVDLLHPDD